MHASVKIQLPIIMCMCLYTVICIAIYDCMVICCLIIIVQKNHFNGKFYACTGMDKSTLCRKCISFQIVQNPNLSPF